MVDIEYKMKYCVSMCVIFMTIFLLPLDWQKKDYDYVGSRNSEEIGFNNNISLKWAFFSTNQIPIYATPMISNGAVLLVLQNGLIYLLKEDNGSVIWQKNIFEETIATPIIDNNFIYLLTKSCNLHVLDFNTGNITYKKLFDATCMDSPVKEANILYISLGFPKNKIVKFDLNTKQQIEEFQDTRGQPFYASGRLDSNNFYVVSTSGMLYKLDKNNIQNVLWSTSFNSIISSWNVTIDNDAFYFFPSGNDLTIYKYNKSTNEILWSKGLSIPKPSFKVEIRNKDLRRMGIGYQSYNVNNNQSQKPSSGSGSSFQPNTAEPSGLASNFAMDSTHLCFIIGLPAYYLVCIDKATSNLVSTTFLHANTGILPIGSPVIKDDLVYYALPVDRKLYISNKNGVVQNSFDLNGEVYAGIVIANAKIFVATNKGALYVFETSANHAPSQPIIISPANLQEEIGDTVTINWEATDADRDNLTYTLELTDGITHQKHIFDNLTENSYTLSNLGLNTPYLVRVRSSDSKKAYSVWSDTITFFYKKLHQITPEPPTNLTITSSQSGSGIDFTVNWTPSSTVGIKYYKYTYRKSGENFLSEQQTTFTYFNLTTNCNDTSQFGCLEKEKNYEIQVRAISIDDLSSIPVSKTFFSGIPFLINNIPQNTLNLQEVIKIANPNDVIKIRAVTLLLSQSMIIDKPLKIQGDNPLTSFIGFDGFEKGIVVTNILPKSGTKTDFKPDVVVEISNLTIINATSGIEINAPTRIKNCVIAKSGTGILANADAEIINNTIADNTGNGISINGGSHIIKNNIIGDNGGVGINLTAGTINLIKYNVLFNNALGNVSSNVSLDNTNLTTFPVIFINKGNNDYREAEGSPSVDAGDPQDDFSLEPLPNGNRINAGAFGNTALATKTTVSQSPQTAAPGGCYTLPSNKKYDDSILLLLLLLAALQMYSKILRYQRAKIF